MYCVTLRPKAWKWPCDADQQIAGVASNDGLVHPCPLDGSGSGTHDRGSKQSGAQAQEQVRKSVSRVPRVTRRRGGPSMSRDGWSRRVQMLSSRVLQVGVDPAACMLSQGALRGDDLDLGLVSLLEPPLIAGRHG